MSRDIVAMMLFFTAAGLLLLAWFLIRSNRVETGRWVSWPPSFNLVLANLFVSLSSLAGVLGVLALGGDGPIQGWGIALVVYPAASVAAFWFVWSRGKGGDDGA